MGEQNNNNKNAPRLSGRTLVLLVGGVLSVAMVAWLVLVIGIFGGKAKKNSSPAKQQEPTEAPKEMVVVYRATAEYMYDGDGKHWMSRTARYDDFGRITEWTLYSEGGSTTSVNMYKYDERGNLVEEIEQSGYGEIRNRYVMTYDENGVKLQRDEYTRDSEQPSVTLYYNKNGKVIKKVMKNLISLYTDGGELYDCTEGSNHTVQSVLSDDGRVLERTDYNRRNEITQVEKFDYDEATGKLTEWSTWENGILTNKTVYEGQIRYIYGCRNGEPLDMQNPSSCQKDTLDEYGNVLSSIFESIDGVFTRTDYEYSPESAKMGKYTKLINYNRDDTVTDYTEYEYSKAWQELKETTYSGDGIEFARHYWIFNNYIGYYWEFDENGNPVRKMAHLSDQDVVVQEYEYTRMVIPKEYMHEDEEHYVGIRYE